MKTIRTVEELDSLPVGAVILHRKTEPDQADARGPIASIRLDCPAGGRCWHRTGYEIHYTSEELKWLLPMSLLWPVEPELPAIPTTLASADACVTEALEQIAQLTILARNTHQAATEAIQAFTNIQTSLREQTRLGPHHVAANAAVSAPETMTERQAAAWPRAVAEAQRHVPSSTIPLDPDRGWCIRWDARWDAGPRGSGEPFNALWWDGEYLVAIFMDSAGLYDVTVADTSWIHSSGDGSECDCYWCDRDRDEVGS